MSDLISRKAVIDWFRCYGHMDEPIPFETLVSDLRDAIPSVDAAPMKRGRWIFKWDSEKDPKRLFIRIVCSECDLHTGMKSNFCPNCGARMDGKEDGADHE